MRKAMIAAALSVAAFGTGGVALAQSGSDDDVLSRSEAHQFARDYLQDNGATLASDPSEVRGVHVSRCIREDVRTLDCFFTVGLRSTSADDAYQATPTRTRCLGVLQVARPESADAAYQDDVPTVGTVLYSRCI